MVKERGKRQRRAKYRRAVKQAVDVVSAHTLIMPDEILSDDRHHDVAMSRHIVSTLVYLRYKPSGLSLKRLGAIMKRDHTTILHSRRAVSDAFDTDPKFKELFIKIKEEYENVTRLSD